MVFLYGFLGLCASVIHVAMLWPVSPAIAIMTAPFVGSASILILAPGIAIRSDWRRDHLPRSCETHILHSTA
jgi:hypothetical protein